MSYDVEVNIKKLRKLREKNKYSITKISEIIGYQTPTSYWLIENGRRNISIPSLYNLSKLYDINVEDLLIVRQKMA